MITISIDVTLLDGARYKHLTRKNGQKAAFCEMVLIETPNSQYGDFIVKQSVTKEERAARKEMPILGNGKHVGQPQGQSDQPARRGPAPAPGSATPETPEDDVPF